MAYTNVPTVDPTLTGPGGRAWVITTPKTTPAHQASIGEYLVNVPGVHPFWSYWWIGAIHLRPIEGTKEPRIDFPGASHEIIFGTLNPSRPLPDISGGENKCYFLTPLDLEYQVILANDEQMAELLTMTVTYITRGNSPDSDYRAVWQNVLAKSAEHIRLGGHPG